MPFNPSLPADNSPLSSQEMRGQLTALNTDIQQRATVNNMNSGLAAVLSQTSNNTNGVATLNETADGAYNATQMQAALDKIDELINTARR